MNERIIDYETLEQLCLNDKEATKLIAERDRLLDEMKGKYLVLYVRGKEPILFPDKLLENKIKELNNQIVIRENVLIQNYLKEK